MGHYTINEVARRLGIRPSRIEYHHRWGDLAEPERMGRMRMYTSADIERIRLYFRDRKPWARIKPTEVGR